VPCAFARNIFCYSPKKNNAKDVLLEEFDLPKATLDEILEM